MAVGVDEDGQKRVLAVLDGATSDPLVCEAVLAELATAGLLGDEPVLVITGGSLALDDTLHLRWNGKYVVAHCRIAVSGDRMPAAGVCDGRPVLDWAGSSGIEIVRELNRIRA